MPHVLYVAYSFPPSRGISSIRSSIFVKYLQELGWDVTVLTGNSTDSSDYMGANVVSVGGWGERLLNGIPRKMGINPKWLRAPDAQKFWAKLALKVAKQIAEKNRIDVFLTTASPFSSHLLGLRLKESTGLPWVAEFRDPWVRNYVYPYPTSFHRNREAKMEEEVIKSAEAIINVTQSLDLEMKRIYKTIPDGRFHVLYNGFDPDSFKGLEHTRTEKFVINYAGSLWNIDLMPIFDALVHLKKKRGLDNRFKLVFTGATPEKWPDTMMDMGLQEFVEFHPPIPHHEVPKLLVESDCILLILYRGKGRERILGGKTGECLAAWRPVLSIAGEGEFASTMRKASAGPVVDPDDTNGIAIALESLFSDWCNHKLDITPNEDLISEFDYRKSLGPKLSSILKKIC